ncbi:MAG TPA: autotransporter assembly complex family protein [Burkholderiales bacterium]
MLKNLNPIFPCHPSGPIRPARRGAATLLAVALCWMLGALPAQAQGEVEAPSETQPASENAGLRYRVDVRAPRPLADMLADGLSLSRWQDDPQMSADLLRRLLGEAVQQTKRAVATEGYFTPTVNARIDEQTTPWTVIIEVDPGPRVIVRDVEIDFSGPAVGDPIAEPLLTRARSSWTLQAGEPFRQQGWDESKRNALTALSSGRYAAARIEESEARIDPETQSASLRVDISSGPVFHFGEVEVTGLKRYPPWIVENFSPMRRREPYSTEKLAIYQRRLLESGYFSSAQIAVDDDPANAAAAPVLVNVIENRKQRLEAGVGYSTDTRYRTQLTYTNVDPWETLWRFKADLRLESLAQSARVDFDSPPNSDASWENIFGSLRRTDIQDEETRELSAGLAHNWGLYRTPSSLYVSAHLEEQIIANEITDHRHAVFFGYQYAFRSTDDLIAPRKGYLGTLTIGGAPAGLSTQRFMRGTARITAFHPLGRNDDLTLRGEAGLVISDSREGIPSTFLFRTGGDQTVRGYAFESLGVDVAGATVGGRFLALGSVEYTHWLNNSLGLAAFVDAGDAADSRSEYDLAIGYGVGVRFRSPIGPLRADVAYGERTNEFRLHFSVGYSF